MVLGHLFSHWTRKDIPHLQGRVAVVTGGNSGIGFEVARHLAQHGAALALVGRKQQLVEWAVEDLLEEFPGADIRPFTCNLEVIKEVQGLSADLLAAYPSIHLLVNNAGRFLDADFATTPEGLEQTMAVNYWGHVALTTLLLDRLIASQPARIVNVVSIGEAFGTYDVEDLTGVGLGSSAARSGIAMYGRSKLMMLMWGYELQRRLHRAGIRGVDVFATHPGIANTAMHNKTSPQYPFSFICLAAAVIMGNSPLQGAQSTLYAATAPSLAGKGGTYYGPQYETNLWHAYPRSPLNPRAYDRKAQAELWGATLEQLKQLMPGEVPPGLTRLRLQRQAR